MGARYDVEFWGLALFLLLMWLLIWLLIGLYYYFNRVASHRQVSDIESGGAWNQQRAWRDEEAAKSRAEEEQKAAERRRAARQREQEAEEQKRKEAERKQQEDEQAAANAAATAAAAAAAAARAEQARSMATMANSVKNAAKEDEESSNDREDADAKDDEVERKQAEEAEKVEAARKKAAEEQEAARKKAEEEEEAARKKAVEEEEAARKKAAEEQEAKNTAVDDDARKKAEAAVHLTDTHIVVDTPLEFEPEDPTLQEDPHIMDAIAKCMNDNKQIAMFEVGGHVADSGDDPEKNDAEVQLSKDRAANVEKALLSRGVQSERIRHKGYGDTTPVASNDTAEGRAKNERIELRIFTQEQLDEQERRRKEAEKAVTLVDGKIEIAAVIKFGGGNANLQEESHALLERVSFIMAENPNIQKIEIQGHCADVGSSAEKDEMEMQLSQDRADTVRSYMISCGTSAQRLIAKGYGDTVPVATNKTKEGRAKNRRVDFVILED